MLMTLLVSARSEQPWWGDVGRLRLHRPERRPALCYYSSRRENGIVALRLLLT